MMPDSAIRPGLAIRSRSHMATKTQEEELRSDLVDALEGFDDAEREGKGLSRQAIAMLCARVTEAFNAYGATRPLH
jgi:hypothetical protein